MGRLSQSLKGPKQSPDWVRLHSSSLHPGSAIASLRGKPPALDCQQFMVGGGGTGLRAPPGVRPTLSRQGACRRDQCGEELCDISGHRPPLTGGLALCKPPVTRSK